MPEHEVTLGEVYRGIQRLDARIEQMSQGMVGRPEYESDKKGIVERFATLDRANAETAADLDTLKGKIEATEAEQRQARGKWTFALVTAGLSLMVAIVSGLVLSGVV